MHPKTHQKCYQCSGCWFSLSCYTCRITSIFNLPLLANRISNLGSLHDYHFDPNCESVLYAWHDHGAQRIQNENDMKWMKMLLSSEIQKLTLRTLISSIWRTILNARKMHLSSRSTDLAMNHKSFQYLIVLFLRLVKRGYLFETRGRCSPKRNVWPKMFLFSSVKQRFLCILGHNSYCVFYGLSTSEKMVAYASSLFTFKDLMAKIQIESIKLL